MLKQTYPQWMAHCLVLHQTIDSVMLKQTHPQWMDLCMVLHQTYPQWMALCMVLHQTIDSVTLKPDQILFDYHLTNLRMLYKDATTVYTNTRSWVNHTVGKLST